MSILPSVKASAASACPPARVWELQTGDALQGSVTSQRVFWEATVPGIPSALGVCPSDLFDVAQYGAVSLP